MKITTLFSSGVLTALIGLTPGAAVAVERHVDAASGIEFILVSGACFSRGADRAGSPDPAWPIPVPNQDEVPRHEVCVDSFWLGKTEVTRQQWTRVTKRLAPAVDRPIIDVTWDEAVQFTQQMSANGQGRFRLPTEAEWEYACHAGAPADPKQLDGEAFFKLLEDIRQVAWYRYQNGRDPQAAQVAAKQTNAWGFYDMLGNVWEWTLDGYDPAAYSQHAGKNPLAPTKDERRVIRGGSYKTDIARVRCGARNDAPKDDKSPVIGFRVVKEYDASQKQEGKK